MIVLTDEQIARVFQLCDEISAVQKELPPLPQGYANRMRLEVAQALRVSFEQHAAAVEELSALLTPPLGDDTLISLGPLARPENS